MSQEDIRRLLIELGKEASLQELSEAATHEFPNRTLHSYLHERLDSMQQKGLVQTKECEGITKWILTAKGETTTLETNICELGTRVSENSLSKHGVQISNLVGSLDLQRALDLSALSEDLDNMEYHPESYPSAIFYPSEESSSTIMIHTSGRISISGARDEQQIIDAANNLLCSLRNLGIEINANTDEIHINNIVANFDFEREFDLEQISLALGLERTEYEPEQFPGLIFQSSMNSTISLFNSGKCVITGAKSYEEVLAVIKEIYNELNMIGVDLPNEYDLD